VAVAFENLSTQDDPNAPLFFAWDFGLGAPTGHETEASPTIDFPGHRDDVVTRSVRLIASSLDPAPTDCSGYGPTECDEQQGSVTLFPGLHADFTASASYSPRVGRPPHAIDFAEAADGDGSGTHPIYEWYRSDVDGTTADLPFDLTHSGTTSFEFPEPGSYAVRLRITTDGPAGTRQAGEKTALVTVSSARWTTTYAALDFASNCTACHGAGDPFVDLTGSSAAVFGRFVDQPSTTDPAIDRIEPFLPDQSMVYEKLVVPAFHAGGLWSGSPDAIDVLRSWIEGGAKDD
jgi:hypothetical protein